MKLACPTCGAKFQGAGRKQVKQLADLLGADIDMRHLCGKCGTTSAEAPDGTLKPVDNPLQGTGLRTRAYCALMGEIVAASAALCEDEGKNLFERVEQRCSAIQGNRPNTTHPEIPDLRLLMVGVMTECIAELSR